jgi:hypothetical protein
VRPYLKKKKKRNWAGGVAQGLGPEFKPSTTKTTQKYKKKKKKVRDNI